MAPQTGETSSGSVMRDPGPDPGSKSVSECGMRDPASGFVELADPAPPIPDPGAIFHVRGSSDGTSTRCARSVMIVGRPAASARSHGPDLSRAVGHRSLTDTSPAPPGP